MGKRTRLWLASLAVVVVSGFALGQETVPEGAEKLLSPEDVRGLHGERLAVLASGGPQAFLGGEMPGPPVAAAEPRIGVSELSPPGRVPVMYIAFDAAKPLRVQMKKAVEGIERCGSREELVLTVRRCVSAAGARNLSDSLARRKAESVARALKRKGFKTEVSWGRLNTHCLVLPAKHRERIHPVEVTVERMR